MMTEKIVTYKSIPLHSGQKRIRDEILQTQAMYSVVNCSRQWGKTTLLQQLLLYYAINNKNWRILYTTRTNSFAKKVFIQICQLILKTNLPKEINKTDRTIRLTNNTTIMFSGTENADALRGDSIHVLICDEFSFQKREAFTEVLRPMLLVKGKKCIIISTPKGKKNLFYQFALYGKDPTQKNYSYSEGNYLENPFYNLADIEDARLTTPAHIFEQEYLGKFIDNQSGIFKNLENAFILNSFAAPTETMYAGLDLASKKDWTVLSIINDKGELVDFLRVNKKGWTTIIDELLVLLKKYNPTLLVEVNSIGDVVYDYLAKSHKKIEAFVTNNASKQQIIENLMVEFEQNVPKLPIDLQVVKNELEMIEVVYRDRVVRYKAIEGAHDDTVISLALAFWMRKNKNQKGVYYFY